MLFQTIMFWIIDIINKLFPHPLDKLESEIREELEKEKGSN